MDATDRAFAEGGLTKRIEEQTPSTSRTPWTLKTRAYKAPPGKNYATPEVSATKKTEERGAVANEALLEPSRFRSTVTGLPPTNQGPPGNGNNRNRLTPAELASKEQRNQWRREGACLLCGSHDHWASECPERGEVARACRIAETLNVDEFFVTNEAGEIARMSYAEIMGYGPDSEHMEDRPLPNL